MPEQTPRTLNHFALYAFKEAYWQQSTAVRQTFHQQWLAGLQQAAAKVHIHQIFPAASRADIMVWSALPIDQGCDTAEFLTRYAQATNPHRHFIQPVETLWGYTRPSEYTKSRSTGEIDPFTDARQPYLVVYPFVKTTDWYLMSSAARRQMMQEHIRIGKQYHEISQTLLYSFGVQDQEFVLVYEMADLTLFSKLVHELRSTEARRFTARDTPLHTAVYHPAAETLALFA